MKLIWEHHKTSICSECELLTVTDGGTSLLFIKGYPRIGLVKRNLDIPLYVEQYRPS